jgi:hypothetical protein
MFMQIFATLFITGFVTLAAIGHVALFHAMFIRRAQPAPQPAERKLRLITQREVEAAHERLAQKSAAPALRIA